MVEKKTPGKTPAKTKKPVIAVIEHDGRQFVALEDVAMMLGINPEPVPANIAREPEETVKNPDCEPATKGYVKHKIRVLMDDVYHKHNLDPSTREFQGILTWISGIAAVISGLLLIFNNPISGAFIPALNQFLWTILIVFGLIWLCAIFSDSPEHTTNPNRIVNRRYDEDHPIAFRKWTPPPCTDKKDCE